MFATTFRNGSEQSYRYMRSVNGRETWTSRSNSGPRDEMVARNDWGCKFANCGDRTVVAGKTVIVKRDGKWGHKVCPQIVVTQVEQDAEVVVANLEMADDLEVELTREYEAIQQAKRAENLKNLQVGTYRVSLDGRRDSDAFNLKITVDRRQEGAFRFKQAESWEGAGRVFPDGRIQLWTNTNLTREEQDRAQSALEVLLGAERMGEYGEAYAREAGACFRCGRELKVEDSIDRGLGKHCAKLVEAGY